MNRGRVIKDSSRLITLWIPTSDIPLIDAAADMHDLDRSKFIRRAIREKMDRANSLLKLTR